MVKKGYIYKLPKGVWFMPKNKVVSNPVSTNEDQELAKPVPSDPSGHGFSLHLTNGEYYVTLPISESRNHLALEILAMTYLDEGSHEGTAMAILGLLDDADKHTIDPEAEMDVE